jgi:hypothetical protein
MKRRAAEEDAHERAFQRACVEDSTCQLHTVQAVVAVLRSKLKATTEREEFVMSELGKMTAELICK